MSRRLLMSLLLWGPLLPAISPRELSQSASPAAVQVEAMKKLDLWVGEWKGSGWSSLGASPRTEFQLAEKVERKVGGTVFLVEGRGTAKNEKGEEVVTHDGLVLVSFDPKTGRYLWQGHDSPWGAMDAEPTLIPGGLQWELRVPERGATLRFVLHFDEKRWHETGEMSLDGKTWLPFMEMTLERQKPAAADAGQR